MMDEWREVKLGDVCLTNTDSYTKKDGWDFVNYLDTGNITANCIDEIQHIDIVNEKLPSRAKRKVKYNSIVYSTVRPNQRHYGIIKSQPENFLVPTGFTVIDVNSDVVDADFLYFLLSSDDIVENLHAIAEQSVSAYPSIKASDIENLEVSLPPLTEQRKISSLLMSIENKIAHNTIINKNLEQQAQTIFKAWFVDFEPFGRKMPKDWEQCTLQNIADFSNGYAFKSKELLDKPMPNCYRVFKQGHIYRGGGFNASGTKSWYPIDKSDNLSKYILRRGDVLMAMTDMKDNVAILGNTALMTVDNQYIVNQRVGLLRSNHYKGTSYAYIYLLTNSVNFITDLRKCANSGVQVNLSSSAIKNAPILIASEATNRKFNELTEPLLLTIMSNSLENEKLSNLRDTLLPCLMSGEIDVSNIKL